MSITSYAHDNGSGTMTAAQAMLEDALLRGSKADLITRAAPAPQRTCDGFGHAYLQLHAADGVVDGVISLQPNLQAGLS